MRGHISINRELAASVFCSIYSAAIYSIEIDNCSGVQAEVQAVSGVKTVT
jgi:hypothetical protein